MARPASTRGPAARPASGSRIRTASPAPAPAPEGEASPAHAVADLLADLGALLARHAAAVASEPGRALWHALEAIRLGARAPAPAASILSAAHHDLACSTLGAFAHLSEAQGDAAELAIYLALRGGAGGPDWSSAQEAFASLVASHHLVGGELAGVARRLTGLPASEPHANHVRILAELVALGVRPEVVARSRDSMLAEAASAFSADD